MATNLSPEIYINNQQILCDPDAPLVAINFNIHWGRAGLFDAPRPSTCNVTILDRAGYLGKKIGKGQILGGPLQIREPGLGKYIFSGSIRTCDAIPMGSAWKITITAADITADMGSVKIGAMTHAKPIEHVRTFLQATLQNAGVDVSKVNLAEDSSTYLTFKPITAANALEFANTFYGSQYAAPWAYNHANQELEARSLKPVVSVIRWYPSSPGTYRLGLDDNTASRGSYPVINGSKVRSDSGISVGIDQSINTINIEYLDSSGSWQTIENNDAPEHNRRVATWKTYLENMQENMLQEMKNLATGIGSLPACPRITIHVGNRVEDLPAARWTLSTHEHSMPVLITQYRLHHWLWPGDNKPVPPVVGLLGGNLSYTGQQGYTAELNTHWQEITNGADNPARWTDWQQDGTKQFYTGKGTAWNKYFIDEHVSYHDMANIDANHMEVTQ